PVEVQVPPAGAQARAACARLTAALPDVLGLDLARRPVTGDPARAAAWGDPPLVLRCGVAPAGRPGIDGEPVTLGPPDGRLLQFLVDDVGAASRFTTRDRRVPVEITVPDAYDAQAVQGLAVPVLDTVPER
ncbi:MAG: DUF3515 domain-containing protein, partial [Actinomycetota bacterium]|nr:DUF3515 domain-containing protein [Actinomycetota bacterium]